MSQTLQHSFQIRKTQFFAQKENADPDGIGIQLVQSTCLSTYVMNRNNVLEGNNLIYINGAYIAFYNFFQNSKQFGAAVTPYRPVGMVGNNQGRGNVTVVTQTQDKSQMYVSVYTFCQDYVPTHIIRKPLIFIDVIMLRATYIALAVQDIKNKENLVYIFNAKTVLSIHFAQSIKRLVCIDHKIYVLFEEGGMFLLDTEKSVAKQDIEPEFKEKKIEDYCEVDNQARILLLQGNVLYCCWLETEKQFEFDLKKYIQPQSKTHRMIKVGRNILVAHRNSLTISHFVVGEQKISFVGNHIYHEKLKAGIVSVQSSSDQMHAALAVEIAQRDDMKIQNFIFNLSSISKSHKFISPFTRVMPMGADCANFNSMQNVLSSNSFLLIGSKIFNVYCSTTFERKKMYNLYQVPKFMTVHPLAYQFLCGFDNIIKFYNKVQKQIQQVWSEQYICTAAKYSKSGALVLSCIEDSFTSLIIYDPYNFRRIKNIPINYLKFYTTRIQWIQNNNCLLLYSNMNNQILKLNIYTGQKLAEFRQNRQKQKKDGYTVKCVEYDAYYDKAILGTSINMIIIAGKGDINGYSLNQMKIVNFPEEVSCIKINYGLKTIFFGAKSGAFYWCNYPLKLKNATPQQPSGTYSICQQLNHIKLHNMPITSIDHTNNNKFMLINIKTQGYFKCRIRKIRSKEDKNTNGNINMNIVFQQLGNLVLNTIDTSSSINYAVNKQKLKIALQKRKECFNDLEEFRRQWELRSVMGTKKIDMNSKKDQLTFITETLAKIQQIKERKKAVKDNIEKIGLQIQEMKTHKEQDYYKQMLQLYEESAKQSQLLETKKKEYNIEYEKMMKQCEQNLKQIEHDLTQKRQNFQTNYELMLKNLQNFKKRYSFEQQQQKQQHKLEVAQYLKNLQIKQIQLNTLSNDLSIKITQAKKQYERYCNRVAFLQHKNRFFAQEHQNGVEEKMKLLELKEKLENQLKQLEVYTDKKQKKLRIYLKANEALEKYKEIHENLLQNAEREIDFIKAEQQKIDSNIIQIQKQLSNVASNNEEVDKEMQVLENQLKDLKVNNYKINLKIKDIEYYANEILAAIENVGYCSTEEEKSQKLKDIYQYFYVQRNIQKIIQKHNKNSMNLKEHFISDRNQKMKAQQLKIVNQLKNQKKYIQNNIQIFNDYSKRINEEINLNFLQIQAQNYNLIAQCNLRKQQTTNKKRMLHQLIDSVKETQIYLNQMKKQGENGIVREGRRNKKSRKNISSGNLVPFVLYEREKEERAQLMKAKSIQESLNCSQNNFNTFSHSRPNTTHKIFAGKSNFTIKKMLDIKGYGDFQQQKPTIRRIQTATNKKKATFEFPQYTQAKDSQNQSIIKPLTATLKSRKLRQNLKSAFSIKNKSSSKPSTCATYTRAKPSIAI